MSKQQKFDLAMTIKNIEEKIAFAQKEYQTGLDQKDVVRSEYWYGKMIAYRESIEAIRFNFGYYTAE